MDFANSPTKNELMAYLKEQYKLLNEDNDKMPSIKASREEWEAYRLTEASCKSSEAWEKLKKAVDYVNEHFTEWHSSRIRNAAGISKGEWCYLSDPEAFRAGLMSLMESLLPSGAQNGH
ncbi:MAG TPA: hypothetical protein VHV10_18105 [Ktedonobacteraceae bacterium]|jgi:hypothetical protein|nr:hypothetical protein [Ktedonobacteraceae bacterium]